MEDIEENRVGWTAAEEEMVFKLQHEYGNRWSAIAMRMPGHTENSVKNKFYSTLRRGLRKINKYITNIRRKSHATDLSNNKLLKPDFLTKLTAIADRNFQQKYEAKPLAIESSQQIQQRFISLARNDQSYEYFQDTVYPFEESLLTLIYTFKKHCKKRKGKRKVGTQSNISSISSKLSIPDSDQEQVEELEGQGVSRAQQYKIQKTNVDKKKQNQVIAQTLLVDPQRKGFQSLPQDQEVRQGNIPQNIIKKSIQFEENVPNYYNPHFSMMTPSTFLSSSYSMLHMLDPSPMVNSFSTYNHPFFYNLNHVESSLPISHSSDPRNAKIQEHPTFFMDQIPYVQPKPVGIARWDDTDVKVSQERHMKDSQKDPSRKISSSEVYTNPLEASKQPLMIKSDSFQSSRTIPHLKNQPTCYSTKKILEHPELPSDNSQ